MQELFRRVAAQINQLWERTEKRDRIRFFVIAGIALAAIITAVVLLNQVEYSVLYKDMEPSEAGQVLDALAEMSVPARPVGTGTIMVPTKDLSRITMELGKQQIPQTGSTYDTFAKGSGFGMTDFEKKKYSLYQIQDRLRDAIQENEGVRQAIVTIATPDASKVIFKQDKVPPSASVMLTMMDGKTLSPEAVLGIEHLIASSVEGMDVKNVSILDNSLNLLNRGDGAAFTNFENNLEYERNVRDELMRSVRNLLTPIYGIDHVQVGVNVNMNFDEKTSESITFSPVNEEDMEGIDVSLREITEKATGYEAPEGVAGVDDNGAAPVEAEANAAESNFSKVTREVNREVNQLQERIKHAQGSITELSVTVVVDSNVFETDPAAAAGATATQEQRPETDPAALTQVVGTAVGLLTAQEQEDHINVSFLPFSGMESDQLVYEQYERERGNELLFELIRSIALYAIIAACIIVVFLTLAKMFRRKPTPAELEAQRRLDEMERGESLTDEELEMQNLLAMATEAADGNIEERVSPNRDKIEDFIDRNPEAVAALLRNWLAEEDQDNW